MTEPTRPKILPTESSIQPPPSLPPTDYWQRYYEESQAMRTRLMRESRIRKVCLEIAMKALEWCASNTMTCVADKALIQIEQRLAQLEPEEEAG